MAEITITVKEATSATPIQKIEHFLHELDGIDRVLVDTTDGDVKIEFDDKKISGEQIVSSLQQHNSHFM